MYVEMTPWVDKLVDSLTPRGKVTEAIGVVPDARDSAWFKKLREHAAVICYTHDRIAFHAPETGKTGKPNYVRNAIVYFGPNTDKFVEEFEPLGSIERRGKIPRVSGGCLRTLQRLREPAKPAKKLTPFEEAVVREPRLAPAIDAAKALGHKQWTLAVSQAVYEAADVPMPDDLAGYANRSRGVGVKPDYTLRDAIVAKMKDANNANRA